MMRKVGFAIALALAISVVGFAQEGVTSLNLGRFHLDVGADFGYNSMTIHAPEAYTAFGQLWSVEPFDLKLKGSGFYVAPTIRPVFTIVRGVELSVPIRLSWLFGSEFEQTAELPSGYYWTYNGKRTSVETQKIDYTVFNWSIGLGITVRLF